MSMSDNPEALLQEAATWLHAAYDRPPQTPAAVAMLARIDAALAQQAATPAPAEPPKAWSQLPNALARHTIQELLSIYDECGGDWCKIARHVEEGVLAKLAAPPATPAAQPAEERQAFEARFPDARAHWDGQRYLSTIYARAWEAWQARAALAARGAA